MKQNLTIALLSVVATLLVVVVVQNLAHKPALVSQTGSGSDTIGMVTGNIRGGGGSDALFIFVPEKNRVATYVLGNDNRLELRSVRNIEYDLQLIDFTMVNRAPTVKNVMDLVMKNAGNAGNAGNAKK